MKTTGPRSLTKEWTEPPRRITVVKLGGSLLRQQDLGRQFRDWRGSQADANRLLVVVGGGESIEAFRGLDRLHQLDPIDMHWRCVRSLRYTSEIAQELLHRWIPSIELIETAEQLAHWVQCTAHTDPPERSCAVVLADAYYTPTCNDVLAKDWATTSDSIAALLARQVAADRLVLLKSCAVPNLGLQQLADQGIVDAAFPQAATGLNVSLEQLVVRGF